MIAKCAFFSTFLAAFLVPLLAQDVHQNSDLCENYERTLLMIKPDAVQRGLIGELIARIERKGLHIVAMKFMIMTEDQAKRHYSDHENKTMFPDLVKYITSGPVVPIVVEGCDSIFQTRLMIGGHPQRPSPNLGINLGANMKYALPGTIRGDCATRVQKNVIHASDTTEAANYEIYNLFKNEEIWKWQSIMWSQI